MATSGEAIERRDGELVVPDQPIIPFIEGDGTGPDIWRASVRVFDAAVEKAYGGTPEDRVARSAGRREGVHSRPGTGCPKTRSRRSGTYLVGIKGPLTTPVGRRHPIAERGAAPGTRPVRLPASGPVLRGHGDAGQAAGPGRHGDLPREHRGHLRRHRVPGGHTGGRGVQDSCSRRASRSCTRRSGSRSRPAFGIKPVSREGTERLVRAAIDYAIAQRAQERDARAQGQHHEVHRGRVPRLGLRTGQARVRRHGDRRRSLVQRCRTGSSSRT